MVINKSQDNGKVTLSLSGRLDTITAPQLQEALLPVFNEASEIILDFTDLAYVSSAGLRVLLIGQKMAMTKGANMIVTNICDEIMEVLDMTGFSNVLTLA